MVAFKKLMAAGVLAAAGSSAHAGIPVIDATAIARFVEQIGHMLTQIENQITMIEQARVNYLSTTGTRGLGSLQRDPSFNNYVPLDAPGQLDGVAVNGYAGMSAAGKAMRDAAMVWNCQGLSGSTLLQCQSMLAQPYQNKALLRQTIAAASGRIGQISGLINAINGTSDQAAKLELGARIQGEQALLQHEHTRAQLLWMDMQNEQRREEARRAESTAEMLSRPIDIRQYLGSTAP